MSGRQYLAASHSWMLSVRDRAVHSQLIRELLIFYSILVKPVFLLWDFPGAQNRKGLLEGSTQSSLAVRISWRTDQKRDWVLLLQDSTKMHFKLLLMTLLTLFSSYSSAQKVEQKSLKKSFEFTFQKLSNSLFQHQGRQLPDWSRISPEGAIER